MAKQEQSRTECLKKCNAAGVKLFWHGFCKRLQEEERRKVASRNSVSNILETMGNFVNVQIQRSLDRMSKKVGQKEWYVVSNKV